MSEHVTEWLNAYLDGELHGARLRQVENHLAECAECRAELDECAELSALLQRNRPGWRVHLHRALRLEPDPEPAAPTRAFSTPQSSRNRLVADPGGHTGNMAFPPGDVFSQRAGSDSLGCRSARQYFCLVQQELRSRLDGSQH